LNTPPFLAGAVSSSHWSGVFVIVIAIIVVDSSSFVDEEKKGFSGKVSEFQGFKRAFHMRAFTAFVLETLEL
jgi:hypothetical protein